MLERVTYGPDGTLDEVVTAGGAHLEHLSGRKWFLNCTRADGSEVAIWLTGRVTMVEVRPAPNMEGDHD